MHEILVVLNYIRKSRTHGLTPKEARDAQNLIKMKVNLEKHRNKTRQCPEVKVGDKVRIYKKRRNFQKSDVSIWSENRYEIKGIEDVPNAGRLYHIESFQKPMLRSEMLLYV